MLLLANCRYEAVGLLLWYVAYVTFMKYNETVERATKRLLNRNKVNGMVGSEAANGAIAGAVGVPTVRPDEPRAQRENKRDR